MSIKHEVIMQYETDDNNNIAPGWNLFRKEELIRCCKCRYADMDNRNVFCIKNKKYFPLNGFCSKAEPQ